NSIFKASTEGGASQTLATGQGKPTRLAIDDQYVYWTNNLAASVMRTLKSGGTPELVAGASQPYGIAADTSSVFWVNQTDSTVVRWDKASGTTTTIGTIQTPTRSPPVTGFALQYVALDSNTIYVAANESHGQAWLFTVPKTGGTPQQLFTTL